MGTTKWLWVVPLNMGSGGSKKNNLEVGYDANRRPSQHELTNPPSESRDLVPCKICNRTFASDRIEKHKDICKSNAKNTRETFDVKEQRLDGTDAEAFKDVEPANIKAKNKWKKTHSNMINAIKEAKKNRPPTAMNDINVHIV